MSIDENSYLLGQRQAWQSILRMAIRELNYDKGAINKTSWIIEREEIINQLRSLCDDFGDNEWPDNLHLGDVIDKHLANHLYARHETE